MTETALSPEDAAAKRAADQARLRKERREAKIKAGGSARLNKITGAGGREPIPDFSPPAPASAEDSPISTPAAKPASTTGQHADPDEVDISEHFYEPKKAAGRQTPSGPAMSDDELRQMMLSFERGNPRVPSPNPTAGPNLEEDPMMKMMSQLMSGAGFPTDGSSPFAGMPGMGGGANPFQAPPVQPQAPSTASYIWRILHALVALGLGLYLVLLTPFAGTKVERERAALPITTPEDPFSTPVEATDIETDLEQRKRLFFWTFATAETLLLTTRFFIDKRGNPPAGIVGTVINFLPQPYKGYVEIVLRYGQIFTTVRSDMLACIFVLGIFSWLRT